MPEKQHLSNRQRRFFTFYGLFTALVILGLLAALDISNTATAQDSTPTPAFAQARVTVTQATVFAEPSRESRILTSLFEGESRTVLGRSLPDNLGAVYYQIELGERSGWVLENQVEISGDVGQIPIVGEARVPDTIVEGIVITEAIVFDQPDRLATEIGRLTAGEITRVIGLTEPDEFGLVFYAITFGEQTGWVPGTQVEVPADSLATLPLITPQPAQEDTPVPALTVTPTVSVQPSATITPYFTDEPNIAATMNAFAFPTEEGIARIQFSDKAPPLTIDLPADWEERHIVLPVNSGVGIYDVALSVYQGPLPEGLSGIIWIVWGFPELVDYKVPEEEFPMWAEGLQYLTTLIHYACSELVPYSDSRQNFTIGDQVAIGAYYAATECGEQTDMAGWFAALKVYNGNYAFYTGVEPVERTQDGLPYLQEILDSVEFLPPEDE